MTDDMHMRLLALYCVRVPYVVSGRSSHCGTWTVWCTTTQLPLENTTSHMHAMRRDFQIAARHTFNLWLYLVVQSSTQKLRYPVSLALNEAFGAPSQAHDRAQHLGQVVHILALLRCGCRRQRRRSKLRLMEGHRARKVLQRWRVL